MSDGDEVEDQPALVPARMLNEYAYCPRLFYLEWVQSQFTDNADTVEGRWVHRVVDEYRGEIKPGEDGEDPPRATSVLLSSEKLGAICRMDLLERSKEGAVPVDYKRGKVPDTAERSWEPERVQLCVQGLILRDNGYRCEKGVLYFAASRTRVTVPFTDELVERTRFLLGELRTVAARDEAPPPLVDSPKCPRCSLVGICLPDETNLAAGRTTRSPRRLIPSDSNAKPLYVTEHRARIGLKAKRVEVRVDQEVVASLRLIDVSQVSIFGNAQISTQLVRTLLREGINICWFSTGGWFDGMASQPAGGHVQLRMRQVAAVAQGDLTVAREVIRAKIMNSRTLLMRNASPRPTQAVDTMEKLANSAASADSIASILGYEGAAARLYFQALPTMLKSPSALPGEPFHFDGRNRRPPRDAINCLLSLCYSLLVKDLSATLQTVGLDAHMGFLHRPRFGRPALALDLCEEFRPLIAESVVLRVVNNGEVGVDDFIVRTGGVALKPGARRTVLRAYERRLSSEITHPRFGYRVTYRRILEVQCRMLGAYLMKEIDSYEGFTTR